MYSILLNFPVAASVKMFVFCFYMVCLSTHVWNLMFFKIQSFETERSSFFVFVFLFVSSSSVLMALTYWLRQRYAMFAWAAGAAALIFRIETLIFLGLFVLGDLLRGRFSAIVQIIKHAIPAAVVLLGKN